jgi:hypothetical protein
MNQLDLSRLSPQELKTYQAGLTIVKSKLDAARKADASHRSELASRSAQTLTARMGADLAKRCFSVSLPTSLAPEPSANPNATYKFFSVSYGRAQNARRLASLA